MKSRVTVKLITALLPAVIAACSVARVSDTAPSVTGAPPPSVYAESDYGTFLAKWLGSPAKRFGDAPYGAASQYVIQVSPPNRPGYNRVGGKELDDALDTFSTWCKTQSGKPVRYSVQTGSDPRMAKFLRKPLSQTPDGFFLACEQDGQAFAVIEVGLDSSTKDRPANLTITNYTAQSVAEAAQLEAAGRARAAQAAVDRARRATLAEEQRNENAKKKFAGDSRAAVKVGDPVCTFSNAFGNVEQVESGRVKVYVIGEANAPIGYFFLDGERPRVDFLKVEAPRWFDKPDLASCTFREFFR